MSKTFKTIIVTVTSAILVLFVGCSAMMDGVTPAYIDKNAAEYAKVDDVTEFLPYTTLWDAKKVENNLNYYHQLNQIELARLLEDDTVEYNFLKDITAQHIQSAIELQNTLFDPSGPIGLLFPALFGGTLGALLIKRPGDKSPKELNNV